MDFLELKELYHHGIKGQKWGIRRFQNDDGTLTEEGKKRYGVNSNGEMSEQGKKNFRYDQSRIRGYSLEKGGYTSLGQTLKAQTVIQTGTIAALGLYGLGKLTVRNANKKGYTTKGEQMKVRLLEAGLAAVTIGTIVEASKKIKRAKDISNYNETNEPKKMVQIK